MKISNCIQFVTRWLGLALMAGALLGARTFAAEATDAPSVTVKYADLKLETPADVAALYKRIHGAAKEVCSHAGARELVALRFDADCAASAGSEAIQRVNNQALSAY